MSDHPRVEYAMETAATGDTGDSGFLKADILNPGADGCFVASWILMVLLFFGFLYTAWKDRI